jgi:hypothetical protein
MPHCGLGVLRLQTSASIAKFFGASAGKLRAATLDRGVGRRTRVRV